MQLENATYLLGLGILIPLVALFVFVLKWKQKVRRQLGDVELINALTANYDHKNFVYKFIFVAAALALCILGAANLRSPSESKTGNHSGIDVMVALDVSNSMLAQDIKPNRLERARQVLNKLIDRMGSNRMGLVVFAGQAFLQMPLTSDLVAAHLYVSNASPDAVPRQGTTIGAALRLCNASLDNKEKKYKAVILISDGEDHDENAKKALETIKESGVVVYTVGIGSPGGAPIFDPALNDFKKDESGVTVVSKLNEKDLQMIATETGGQYMLFTNVDEVTQKLSAALNNMEKKHIGGSGVKTYNSYFQWFLLVAFLLLLIEVIIPERKTKWFKWAE